MKQRSGGTLARGATVLAAVCGAAVASAVGAQPAGASVPARAGEWRFDESGGQSVIDYGPYGLSGQLGSSAQADAADPARIAGASGGALRFDGNSFVSLPGLAGQLDLPTLTAEAVVRAPSSPGPWRYVVSRGSGNQTCYAGSYGLYTGAASGIAFYVFDGSRYVVSATARPSDVWDGSWHHVAGTFDGQALRLYVDGRPVGDPIDSPIGIDYLTTSTRAYFGRFVGGCALGFQGDLDFVRLWSGALSSDAVAAATRGDLPGDGAPPPSGAPLPAAAPGTIIAGPSNGTKPSAGGPDPACVLRPSRKRVVAERRTVVRVRATRHGRPVRAMRVVATRPGRSKVLAAGRTGTTGWARHMIRTRRLGRVLISSAAHRSCTPVYIRVKA